jgi:hypothetical protein
MRVLGFKVRTTVDGITPVRVAFLPREDPHPFSTQPHFRFSRNIFEWDGKIVVFFHQKADLLEYNYEFVSFHRPNSDAARNSHGRTDQINQISRIEIRTKD